MTLSPHWEADITLLDFPEGAAPVRLSLRRFPTPSLLVMEGAGVTALREDAPPGTRVIIPPEGLTLGIAGTEIRVHARPPVDIARDCLAALRRRPANLRKWLAGLATGVVISGVAAVAFFGFAGSGISKNDPAPPPPASDSSAAGFENRVLRSTSSIVDRAARAGIRIGEGSPLSVEQRDGLIVLSGRVETGADKALLEQFHNWYDTQPNMPPLVRQLTNTAAAPVEYPVIDMVVAGQQQGAKTVMIVSGNEKIGIGERLASGWIFEAYEDGFLILSKNGTTIRVRAFARRSSFGAEQ